VRESTDVSDDLYRLFRRWGLTELGANSLRHLVEIVVTLLLAMVISRVTTRAARRWTQTLVQRSSFAAAVRAQTLGGVAASVIRIIVWSFAGLFVLGELGLDLGPFIAGASVVGVALGFGAQTLVKDFLAGFFILAEDQYGVGDEVTVGGETPNVTGIVEEVSLRITRLRGEDGTVWYVPNGDIRKVGNRSRST
jgi:moderate conductance mechanosensitive channel